MKLGLYKKTLAVMLGLGILAGTASMAASVSEMENTVNELVGKVHAFNTSSISKNRTLKRLESIRENIDKEQSKFMELKDEHENLDPAYPQYMRADKLNKLERQMERRVDKVERLHRRFFEQLD